MQVTTDTTTNPFKDYIEINDGNIIVDKFLDYSSFNDEDKHIETEKNIPCSVQSI